MVLMKFVAVTIAIVASHQPRASSEMTSPAVAEATLAGCMDQDQWMSLFRRLQERKWADWTPSAIDEAWPLFLEDVPTEDVILRTGRGRVINSECECCDTFQFDRVGGEHRLSAMIFVWSDPDKRKVLRRATDVAESLGADPSTMNSLQAAIREAEEGILWAKTLDAGVNWGRVNLEVSIQRVGQIWEMVMSVGSRSRPQAGPDPLS